MTSAITQKNGHVLIECRISPRARRSSIRELRDDALLVSVKAPPVDGKANEELIRFLSDCLGVRRTAVSIERGHSSKSKLVSISGLDVSTALSRINQALSS